ncbi:MULTISPECIES: MerR family transcriptional regulator [unclassified Lactococcus]|uniref:MerR family transcriptional regulator n=1 Tax=unclassified Lactococcus TaxID=2643510 RepID=UPI0011CB4A60|nr:MULTISPECIES: MerR family transcriptional regulator [unclassified Lactococcus]MQW23277.1 MerR family transcriptional regulator [Lactococcus sp. dk101]TXK38056.1 MerR family transcriptional regulator [Lactococcus sp. dk310]TXK49735.1 MerR family transcriptional regulator [Lactococcus sp. dk322]
MNIKEVSELFDLSPATIRYYEEAKIIPPITRNLSGYRSFTDRDLNWIYLVKSLRRANVSIESLKTFASYGTKERTPENQMAQKEILAKQLQEVEDQLEEATLTRDLLKFKLDTYDDHIAKFVSGEWDDNHVEKLWEK